MKAKRIESDERTVAVENSSYRIGFQIMVYGVLAAVAWRGLLLQQAAWDLLALVVIGSGIPVAIQSRHSILQRGWIVKAMLSVVIAAVLGLLLILALR